MAHDQLSFYKSATGAASTQVDALADQLHTVSGSNMLVPPYAVNLLYAFGAITNASDVLANMRLSSPSLVSRSPYEITVFNDLNGTPSTTYTMPEHAPVDIVTSPISLAAGEALSAYMGSSGTTGSCLHTGVVGLSDGQLQNPYQNMPIEVARYTNGSTLTAHAYTNGALTVTNQTFRAGTYACVGMKYYGATAQAARLVMLDRALRPGCIGVTQRGHKGHPIFRQGNLGVWGQFSHVTLPTVDFLANAADTAQVVDLDVVKIA